MRRNQPEERERERVSKGSRRLRAERKSKQNSVRRFISEAASLPKYYTKIQSFLKDPSA
jgi:hypothetical protein